MSFRPRYLPTARPSRSARRRQRVLRAVVRGALLPLQVLLALLRWLASPCFLD